MSLCLLAGCKNQTPDGEYARPGDTGLGATRRTTLVKRGEAAYRLHCIGCHGAEGDGKGEAAKFFKPSPRNFVAANFKFSSTRSGRLPTDDDLRRTITHGLRGSAMPPFKLLPNATVDALIAYIKTFSPKWKERQPASPVPFVDDPYRSEPDKSEAVARGEMIYHGYATCWTCHPAYLSPDGINAARKAVGFQLYESFRENLHQSVGKENIEGEVIFPPDFERDSVRAGSRVQDLYRSIAAGITGTAMPTWVDSIEVPGPTPDAPPLVQPSDLWAVAYYVKSLIEQRPARLPEDRITLRTNRRRAIYLHGEPPKPEAPPEPEEETGEPADFGFD
ncbi:MAG: c-type cytochrome [Phycisphaerae bacterium]